MFVQIGCHFARRALFSHLFLSLLFQFLLTKLQKSCGFFFISRAHSPPSGVELFGCRMAPSRPILAFLGPFAQGGGPLDEWTRPGVFSKLNVEAYACCFVHSS
ncbi:hypothetical protein AMAG_19626 [Allomyces macrogynus ATCC 38327]|uniref:Secreted protein n=1 Tax=Allomyces macrogynus (strain ATCC 38327) TaxID=578462 RepID=A0A0L0SY28_ALLM3|nr:hypothetical protein AMAG_19626 [Allomyces macrogynus ATCC 38327]|eukprot:KNE67406.1 hypothetical protein AMAG_19626 [Allomyces macrogynus ATCC 38327]